jgi:predicted nucleic-acid-binding protein
LTIAIDTNVLVRYLTWDDERQAGLAAEAIDAADSVVVSTIVLCETVWVLVRVFKLPRRWIAEVMRDFITSDKVEVDRLAAEAGMARLEQGGDFADGVIQLHARQSRADRLVTFDRTFAETPGDAMVMVI